MKERRRWMALCLITDISRLAKFAFRHDSFIAVSMSGNLPGLKNLVVEANTLSLGTWRGFIRRVIGRRGLALMSARSRAVASGW